MGEEVTNTNLNAGSGENQHELEEHLATLERECRFYHELFEYGPEACLVTSPSGMIEKANRKAAELFSVRQDYLVGKPLSLFVVSQDRTELFGKLGALESARNENTLSGVMGPPEELEVAIRSRAGNTFDCALTIGRQFDEEGHLARLHCILRDVSARNTRERALSENAADLLRVNVELEQFVTIAAHDLQEPARVVSIYTQLLAEKFKGQLDEETQTAVGFIKGAAGKMMSLIHDLLVYGSTTKQAGTCELGEACAEAIKNLAPAIKESQAEINVHDLACLVVSQQFVLVFENLISNAIKFHSEKTLKVDISSRKTSQGWVISFADNGIGFDNEYAERMFGMFQRLHRSEQFPGNGIGLAIVRKLVEQHNGEIWARSSKNGATFFIKLPVQDQ